MARPKSSSEIRRLLNSIHDANQPIEPAPRKTPMKKFAQKPTLLSREDTQRLLMKESGIAGAFMGFLLGLNLGLVIPIVTNSVWSFAFAPLSLALLGSIAGFTFARNHVVNRCCGLFGVRC